MIYITWRELYAYGDSVIHNIWEIEDEDLEQQYKQFFIDRATDFNIVINPHWGNIMNRENHNTHLTEAAYKKKEKDWNKFLKLHTFDWFIEDMGGIKVKHINIY